MKQTTISLSKELTKKQQFAFAFSSFMLSALIAIAWIITDSNLLGIIFFLVGLPIIFNLIDEKNNPTTAHEFLTGFTKDILRWAESVINYCKNVVYTFLIRIVWMMYLSILFGYLTLWIFALPGGIIGAIANYLAMIAIKNNTGFVEAYASFSTAIVFLVLVSISISKFVLEAIDIDEAYDENVEQNNDK
ncbi:MAG: hypothetical protein HY865_01040 [Chloroflexi bacterium]|nr:hypothetical protein [Chloroflexota bacterium]